MARGRLLPPASAQALALHTRTLARPHTHTHTHTPHAHTHTPPHLHTTSRHHTHNMPHHATAHNPRGTPRRPATTYPVALPPARAFRPKAPPARESAGFWLACSGMVRDGSFSGVRAECDVGRRLIPAPPGSLASGARPRGGGGASAACSLQQGGVATQGRERPRHGGRAGGPGGRHDTAVVGQRATHDGGGGAAPGGPQHGAAGSRPRAAPGGSGDAICANRASRAMGLRMPGAAGRARSTLHPGGHRAPIAIHCGRCRGAARQRGSPRAQRPRADTGAWCTVRSSVRTVPRPVPQQSAPFAQAGGGRPPTLRPRLQYCSPRNLARFKLHH